jgi:predicted O-methyltransferase YrrM
MLDTQRLSHIKSLQRSGEAEALYAVAVQAPYGSDMVELGTFHGYTAGVLGLAAMQTHGNVLTMDDYQERPEQNLPKQIGAEGVRLNIERAGVSERVTVIEGDTRTVPSWIYEIGLLWIDSTHTAEHVTAELAAWLPHVVIGGIIAFHDYGGASTPQLKAPIDQAFKNNLRWKLIAGYHTVIAFKRLS